MEAQRRYIFKVSNDRFRIFSQGYLWLLPVLKLLWQLIGSLGAMLGMAPLPSLLIINAAGAFKRKLRCLGQQATWESMLFHWKGLTPC